MKTLMTPFKSLLNNWFIFKFTIAVTMLIASSTSKAQNLIPNGSFENTQRCTNSIAAFNLNVLHWTSPTTSGTTDLFNTCGVGLVGVPDNNKGKQYAYQGENYAGLYVYHKDNYREYAQNQLTEPLEKGTSYTLSFYISLAEESDYAIKNIDVLFTESDFRISTSRDLSRKQLKKNGIANYSLIKINNNQFYNNKVSWVQVRTTFIANGREQFLTIGNFEKNSRTDKLRVKGHNYSNMSYYFLDAVELSRTSSIAPSTITEKELASFENGNLPVNRIVTNKNYTFNDVVFYTNSSELNNNAKSEISELFEYLRRNVNDKAVITGHTDNIGSLKDNLKLSKDRASAVVDYLIYLGLDKDRVKFEGYGSTKPISTNDSEIGKSKNRRVTFKIVKEF